MQWTFKNNQSNPIAMQSKKFHQLLGPDLTPSTSMFSLRTKPISHDLVRKSRVSELKFPHSSFIIIVVLVILDLSSQTSSSSSSSLSWWWWCFKHATHKKTMHQLVINCLLVRGTVDFRFFEQTRTFQTNSLIISSQKQT